MNSRWKTCPFSVLLRDENSLLLRRLNERRLRLINTASNIRVQLIHTNFAMVPGCSNEHSHTPPIAHRTDTLSHSISIISPGFGIYINVYFNPCESLDYVAVWAIRTENNQNGFILLVNENGFCSARHVSNPYNSVIETLKIFTCQALPHHDEIIYTDIIHDGESENIYVGITSIIRWMWHTNTNIMKI